jgi:hypothetical protein
MSETRVNETHPPRRFLRSLAALFVGMLVGIILTIATGVVLTGSHF